MTRQIVIPALALFFFVFGPRPGFAVEPASAPEQEKKIEERTGGMLVRQPAAEQKWKRTLDQMAEEADQKAGKARTLANTAILNAGRQLPLLQNYVRDIWAQIKSEYAKETTGNENQSIDEDYVRRLVEKNQEQSFYERTHLYVFISESVPLTTLRNYIKALDSVPVVFVLRGMVGDDPAQILPTQNWINSLLCDDPPYTKGSRCYLYPVDINPTLYRLFGIETVPALAYVPNPTALDACGGSTLPADQWHEK